MSIQGISPASVTYLVEAIENTLKLEFFRHTDCRVKIYLAEILTLQSLASKATKHLEDLSEELAGELANSSAALQIDVLRMAISTKSLPTSPDLLLLISGGLSCLIKIFLRIPSCFSCLAIRMLTMICLKFCKLHYIFLLSPFIYPKPYMVLRLLDRSRERSEVILFAPYLRISLAGNIYQSLGLLYPRTLLKGHKLVVGYLRDIAEPAAEKQSGFPRLDPKTAYWVNWSHAWESLDQHDIDIKHRIWILTVLVNLLYLWRSANRHQLCAGSAHAAERSEV